jgi:hypothetical protein
MVMLETVQRIADASLKTASAKWVINSAQSIPLNTMTALQYKAGSTSDSNILSVSSYNIWIDSRVRFFTIDIQQSANQSYNYYVRYPAAGDLNYCTVQGTTHRQSFSFVGTRTDGVCTISVYGAAGTMTSDGNWNWARVSALYV